MPQKHIFSVFILAGYLCLSACSGLLESPQEADRTFILTPVVPPVAGISISHNELLKLKLRVVPGLDTDRLVTVSDSTELSYFSAARWPDNLPEFTGSLIERSLRAHGWQMTNPSKKTLAGESCELQIEIEKFYTLLDSAGQPFNVQIQWDGYYSCEAFSVPVRVSESVQLGQKDIKSIVKAFQQGFALAMQSTIRQMSAAGSD